MKGCWNEPQGDVTSCCKLKISLIFVPFYQEGCRQESDLKMWIWNFSPPALSKGPYKVVQLPRSVAGNSGSSLTRGNSEDLEIQFYVLCTNLSTHEKIFHHNNSECLSIPINSWKPGEVYFSEMLLYFTVRNTLLLYPSEEHASPTKVDLF
jgi:hypothetical protein